MIPGPRPTIYNRTTNPLGQVILFLQFPTKMAPRNLKNIQTISDLLAWRRCCDGRRRLCQAEREGRGSLAINQLELRPGPRLHGELSSKVNCSNLKFFLFISFLGTTCLFFQVRVPHLGLPLELSSRSLPREQQEDAHKGVRAKVGTGQLTVSIRTYRFSRNSCKLLIMCPDFFVRKLK